MRKAAYGMEGSAAQCIGQGMPAGQCTGRQVSPRVESCVTRWQNSTLFKEILEHAAANRGTRSGQPTARSLFKLTPNKFSLFVYVFERGPTFLVPVRSQ